MGEWCVYQVPEEGIGRETDFAVAFDGESFAGVDVHAFPVTNFNQLERAQSFDFYEFVVRKSLFNHLEERLDERFGLLLGDSFPVGNGFGQVLYEYFVVFHP